jgi:DNA methylase
MAALARKPSAVIDTRVIYCGDNLDQLRKLPDACVELIYIDPPFNSNRNYEVFWGETKEKRSFEDRHESTKAYIDYMRPRCIELHRVLKKTGCFYYHCDWHASHYVKVMLDQIFGENQFRSEIIWQRTSSTATLVERLALLTTVSFFTRHRTSTHGTRFTFRTPNSTSSPNSLVLKAAADLPRAIFEIRACVLTSTTLSLQVTALHTSLTRMVGR